MTEPAPPTASLTASPAPAATSPFALPPSPSLEDSETLRSAIRLARVEASERTTAVDDLRVGEMARLELLRDALSPIFAQVPAEMDIFDHGLATGDRPRYFVDVVAFVQMARDRRRYRFVQETRGGPLLIVEDERLETVVDAVTAYIGRRIVEREQTLSAPSGWESASPPPKPAAALQPASAAPRIARSRWPVALAFLLGLVAGAGGLLGYALWRTAPPGAAITATRP